MFLLSWIFPKLKDARIMEPERTMWSSFLLSELSRLCSERKTHSKAHSEWLAGSGPDQIL